VRNIHPSLCLNNSYLVKAGVLMGGVKYLLLRITSFFLFIVFLVLFKVIFCVIAVFSFVTC